MSYVDYLQLSAKANKFVSHAWKYTFQDIVAALETSNEDGDVLWFDICTVNQHKSETHDFDWWQTTFQDAVREVGCTVLVLSPWERPIPLTRSWCIWEIYSTIATKGIFDVAMPPRARMEFREALVKEFDSITKAMCRIDAETAEAFSAEEEAVSSAATAAACRQACRQVVVEAAAEAAASGRWLRSGMDSNDAPADLCVNL